MKGSIQKSKKTNQKVELFNVDKYFAEEIQQGEPIYSKKRYHSSGISIAKINTGSSNYRKSQTKGFR